MFSHHISYLPILQAVAQRCRLSYISAIHQVADDGTHMYGVELELPPQPGQRASAVTMFFWAPYGLHESVAYEFAAFQALVTLQNIFCFVIVDYSIHGLLLYRTLAQRLSPVANRGIHLARLVMAASNQQNIYFPSLIASVQQLIDEIISIPDGMFP